MKLTTFLLLVLASVMNDCDTTQITCPDGSIAVIQKNPEKQYPAFVKSSQTDVKAAIDVLGKIKVSGLDVTTKNQITELRNKLDSFTSQFDIIAKSSYLAFNTTPCDANVRTSHFKVLADLAAVQKFKAEVDKLTSSGNIAGLDEDKLKALINQTIKESNEKGTGFKAN